VITSADADHLDIYGTHDEVKGAFSQFAAQIEPGGKLILKEGVDLSPTLASGVRVQKYSMYGPTVTTLLTLILLTGSTGSPL
jgi:UDP-N-acetylmuramate--alanine ligase